MHWRAVGDKLAQVAAISATSGSVAIAAKMAALPIKTWRQIVVTADGESLQIYEDCHRLASTPCSKIAASESETVWFGTSADGSGLWNGRIDEVALFNRTLSGNDIAELYLAAQKQMAKSG